MLTVPIDLVRKYDVPAPRYTSYPTALQFRDHPDPAPLLAHLDAANHDASLPLSLYVHLPFCETLCWFCGCTTVITTQHDLADTYIDALERELALLAPRLHPDRSLVQVHYGGGTPTFLSPAQLRRLAALWRRHLTPAPDAETSVEIDPRRIVRDHITALRDSGFSRASLGVQDFNPVVQKAVHRLQPRDITAQAIDWLRSEGFSSVNLDLIYGLPHQTLDSFATTLDEVIALAPDRLAIFSYAHVPWMKPAQRILEREGALPPPEAKLAMLKLITETLTSRGWVYIGMDHFARPDDELAVAQRQRTLQRNFQGYSTRSGVEILGLGISAISQTPSSYRQNHKTLDAYNHALSLGTPPVARGLELTPEDVRRREIIMRIMCHLRLDFAETSRDLGTDIPSTYAAEIARLEPLAADGLVHLDPSGITVTDLGRLLLRNIAACFDAYYQPASGRHSRSV